MDVEAKLAELEKRLAELDSKVAETATKKDIWDRFSQIGPILITLAVAAGGWVVTDMMKRMDVNATQRQMVIQENTARMSTRVSQAQLVSTFLPPLLGDDPDAQKLAISALLIVMIPTVGDFVTPRMVGGKDGVMIANAIQEETVKITLWGLLGMVLVVPLAVLLTISVIGIVLIPLEMILVVSAGLLGFIAISQLLGRRLYALFKRPSQHILRETFWGLVVLWIIGWLPYIGWMIKVLALMMGLGAVIYTRFGTHVPRRLSSANINI